MSKTPVITITYGAMGYKLTSPGGVEYYLSDREATSAVLVDLVTEYDRVEVVVEDA